MVKPAFVCKQLKGLFPIHIESKGVKIVLAEVKDSRWIAESFLDSEYIAKYSQKCTLTVQELGDIYNRYIADFLDESAQREKNLAFLKIVDSSSGLVVGAVHICDSLVNREPGLVIGYWIKQDMQGMGITSTVIKEIIVAIKKYGYSIPIVAAIAKENKRSIKLIKKCGFQFIGYQDDNKSKPRVYRIYTDDADNI